MSDGSSWSVIVGSYCHGVISSVSVLQYVQKEVKETHDRPEHQSSSALKWFQSQLTNLKENQSSPQWHCLWRTRPRPECQELVRRPSPTWPGWQSQPSPRAASQNHPDVRVTKCLIKQDCQQTVVDNACDMHSHVRWWWEKRQRKIEEKNTDMSDGGDNFSESVSGVRSSSMILLFQESELLHLKMINIKYSNDPICWCIYDDDNEKGGEMKSPWFEERLARPPPPFHLHSVITDKLTEYIFKDSFTFSLPLAFCTFKKTNIWHSQPQARRSRRHSAQNTEEGQCL